MVRQSHTKSSTSKKSRQTKSKQPEKVYSRLIMNGVLYLPNDTAKICEVSDPCSFARILKIYKRRDEAYILVQWFYKPKDIFGAMTPDFLSNNELFESNLVDEIFACTIVEKADIVVFDEYCNLSNRSPSRYFYRAKYLPQTCTVEPPLEIWQTICICNKIYNPDLRYTVCQICSTLYHMDCKLGITNCIKCKTEQE